MIRIDEVWLALAPVDMRAGADRLLASVVQVFGTAQAHHGYLFANARATRIKLLVHDGFGVWCAARRLNIGGFVWPRQAEAGGVPITLTQEQFGLCRNKDIRQSGPCFISTKVRSIARCARYSNGFTTRWRLC